MTSAINDLVAGFLVKLAAVVEQDMANRIQVILGQFVVKRKPGRPPKPMSKVDVIVGAADRKPRKPRAKVLCPVPGCEGVAAPVFGMVCSAHRNVPATKIARYRMIRKAEKAVARGEDKPVEARKGSKKIGAKITKNITQKHLFSSRYGKMIEAGPKSPSKKAAKKTVSKVAKKTNKKIVKKAAKKAGKTTAHKISKMVAPKGFKKTAKKASPKAVVKKFSRKASKKISRKITPKASQKVIKEPIVENTPWDGDETEVAKD
jgi:hypothetical protein